MPDAEARFAEVLAELLQAEERGERPDWRTRAGDDAELLNRLEEYFHNREAFARLAPKLTPMLATGTAGGWMLTEALRPGSHFGAYEIVSELGQGGMGVVYRARQAEPERLVALKVIRTDRLERLPPEERREWVERFRHEAQLVATLDEPTSIVTIYEVGEWKGQPYFTMRLVEGGSLADWLHKPGGRPAIPECARLAARVARAVEYAHCRGVLHRDLKPGNILLDGEGRPLVTDFGLAGRVDASGRLSASRVEGTIGYMAPEQAAGAGEVTTAADVYGLGAILYELLTGRPPGRSPAPPRQANPSVDVDLQAICLKALAHEPHDRYANAAALADDLDRWLDGRTVRALPGGPWKRTAKWTRRHPLIAGLLALTLLVGALGVAGITWQWLRATAAANDLADSLYLQSVALAERELSANNIRRAEEVLDGCPENRRGWEWHCLKRLCHEDAPSLRGPKGALFGVAFSPDGKRLASASFDGDVHVWEAATGRVLRVLPGDGQPVRAVAFSPDGRQFATVGGGQDDGQVRGQLRLWDTAEGRLLREVSVAGVNLWCVAFSPDGKQLAVGGGGLSVEEDGEVRLWDTASGRLIRSQPLPRERIFALAFSPDGQRLAGGGEGRTLRLWDSATGKELLKIDRQRPVFCVAFSPDGRHLVSGGGAHYTGDTGDLTVWDAATGEIVWELHGHTDEVWSVVYHPDGRRIASACFDRTVKLWDTRTGRETLTLRGHQDHVRGLAFSPDGTYLASASEDRTVRLWRAETPGQGVPASEDSFTLAGHSDRVWAVAFSADGRRLASASEDQAVKIWDLETRRVVQTLDGHARGARSLAFGPSGDSLATASFDGTARLWDLKTGQFRTLDDQAGWLNSIAFSPDGRRLATVSSYSVLVWAADGQPLHTLTGHRWTVSVVAFSPDRRLLASGSWDQTVKLWDVASGKEVRTLRGHTGRVRGVAFSPDGARLASGSNDGTVRLWEVATGRELGGLRGHTNKVLSVAYRQGGQHLASAGQDQTVRVWDAATGQELLTLRGHAGQVRYVVFSPDGRWLAVASGDEGHGEVKLWDMTRLVP